jgi:hypothetical protein
VVRTVIGFCWLAIKSLLVVPNRTSLKKQAANIWQSRAREEVMEPHFVALESALVSQAKAASIFSSGTAKGRAREIFVQNFLEDHLPARVTVRRGEIIDSLGNNSGEVDAIIVDHDSMAFNIGGEHLTTAEAAVAGIEIKSDLTGDNLIEAVRKACLVKTLRRSAHHGFYQGGHGDERVEIPPRSPNFYIVGFRGPTLETIDRRISENPEWYSRDFMRYGFDILCILERGFIFKNDGLIFNPALWPGLDHVIMNNRPGTRHIIGHLQETLARFGGLTYELRNYHV